MKRRSLIKSLATGIVGAPLVKSSDFESTIFDDLPPRKNLLMRVGGDNIFVENVPFDDTSKENLEFKLRHGVKHITAKVNKIEPDGSWDLDELKRMKENCDKYEVVLESLNLGNTLETQIENQLTPNITLGKSPERDKEIEVILGNIRKAGEIGVSTIRYHWRILPILRNGTAPGRGGSIYRKWDIEENWEELPMSAAGRVTRDMWWERYSWFLERVLPVAEQSKVKMACHIPDPPLPLGYRGVDHWNHDVFDGLKKVCALSDSPYHGLLLCIGTVAEGLDNPGKDIYEIIKYFGLKKKIFCVHLRNIRGGRDHFTEVYPDEGEIDFYKVIKILRDVQYPYSILPDHMPEHPDDPRKLQAFAFGYGYIIGLINSANSEV